MKVIIGCFGCFHSFRCKSTLEKHTQIFKDHDFCKIKLPENNEKIKEHKPGLKALRMNDRIYVHLESFLVGYDTCLNTPIISHTTNIAQHIPSGYAITILRNHNKSTKVTYYREKDCIQKLCEDLRDIANELLVDNKAKIKNLTSDEKESHENAEISHKCGNTFSNNKKSKYYKNFEQVKDNHHYTGIYRSAAHSICSLRYSTQRDIPVVIHNGSNYDFHLIIKELAKEFKEEIHCIPLDK